MQVQVQPDPVEGGRTAFSPRRWFYKDVNFQLEKGGSDRSPGPRFSLSPGTDPGSAAAVPAAAVEWHGVKPFPPEFTEAALRSVVVVVPDGSVRWPGGAPLVPAAEWAERCQVWAERHPKLAAHPRETTAHRSAATTAEATILSCWARLERQGASMAAAVVGFHHELKP